MLRTLGKTFIRSATPTLTKTTAAAAARRTISSLPIPPSVPFRPLRQTFRQASTTAGASSTLDPQQLAAQDALDQGTAALEIGDLEAAKEKYEESLKIKDSAVALFSPRVVAERGGNHFQRESYCESPLENPFVNLQNESRTNSNSLRHSVHLLPKRRNRYQLQDLPGAILHFESSISLTPPPPPIDPESTTPSPLPTDPTTLAAHLVLADTHTNLGAAYILSKPPRPDLALSHLQSALELNPDDGETVYNLAAVLEALGEEHLDESLVAYNRAVALGIKRAEVNVRNISAKILGKRLKEEEEEKKKGGEAVKKDA